MKVLLFALPNKISGFSEAHQERNKHALRQSGRVQKPPIRMWDVLKEVMIVANGWVFVRMASGHGWRSTPMAPPVVPANPGVRPTIIPVDQQAIQLGILSAAQNSPRPTDFASVPKKQVSWVCSF